MLGCLVLVERIISDKRWMNLSLGQFDEGFLSAVPKSFKWSFGVLLGWFP